ncbi:MAG: patatin-like phospholipase family protein [Prevotellaceae bacterium]|jgi:NTE family protein|nr:patatin-like phospholipase family protein [Prevotellaceae bacterium]
MKYICIMLALLTTAVNVGFSQKKTENKSKDKIGIVLSGGAARGFAHLGVLQALEDNGIVPDYVSGSSMGAVIGSAYAAGKTPAEIYDFGRKANFIRLYRPTLRASSLFKTTFLQKMLDDLIPHDDFGLLKKKLFVCMTNLNTAHWDIASTGTIKNKVIASASIPFVFEPSIIDSTIYVDGGLLNNLPVEPLKAMPDCKHIIGVSVNSLPHKTQHELLGMEALVRTVSMVVVGTEMQRRKHCNYYIEVDKAGTIGLLEFSRIDEFYQMGYEAVVSYIESHPEILQLSNRNEKNVNINDL